MIGRLCSGGRNERIAFSILGCVTVISLLPFVGIMLYLLSCGWRPLGERCVSPILIGIESHLLMSLLATVYVMVGSLLIAVLLGIGVGIYLSEYACNNLLGKRGATVLNNLANIPPVLYGLFGWAVLAKGNKGTSWSVILLTLAVWMLPNMASVTLRALNEIPPAFRRESQALGATRWQTSLYAVLRFAKGRIISDFFKASARLIGETAPLLVLIGVEPWGDLSGSTPLAYRVYVLLVGHMRRNQTIPYGAALLLLVVALCLQLIGLLIEPAQQEDIDYLGN
ncbi:MAG: ABC transporter permease subunit [Firmicutes bacterium]|nr:ABC transporter permease subunit [Bacillota bacterium]